MRRLLAAAAIAVALGGACAMDDSGDAATGPSTTRPVLPEGACVARMSDPNPGQGGTVTAIVYSHFASVPVIVVAHYKSTDSTHTGSIDSDMDGEVEFSIGKPTKGHPVLVDVTVRGASANEICQTAFTPN